MNNAVNNQPDQHQTEDLSGGSIYVAGHQGMVGSALVRRLHQAGYENLLLRNREQLNLENQQAVRDFFHTEKPAYVFLAAAKVGGIHVNDIYPADFIYSNLMIASNVIHAAYQTGVKRLLFLGSSCIYPKHAAQPMPESSLLTGTLEPTNEPYAIAKIAGIKLCESYNRQHGTDFRSVMPTNLYGPEDNFDLQSSHVLPALLHKFHLARQHSDPEVEVWGTGTPRREFLHVDDLADACLFVASLAKRVYHVKTKDRLSHLNVGTGKDIAISELAQLIKTTVGYDGQISFNSNYPDGTAQKLLDTSALSSIGWNAAIGLQEGLESTYRWFLENHFHAKQEL